MPETGARTVSERTGTIDAGSWATRSWDESGKEDQSQAREGGGVVGSVREQPTAKIAAAAMTTARAAET